MNKQTIYLNNQHLILDAAQLIQSGGEGMVFDVGDNTAVKLYHTPQPHHAAKLAHIGATGLARRLPPGVLGPQTIAVNKQGQVIGFQMPKLPAGVHALKRLATPLFWQQQQVTMPDVMQLFQSIHATLAQLHHLGVIVGDLNDQNLFFLPPTPGAPRPTPDIYWLDVDSYQFDRFPCPVAMLSFLDPQLHHVTDFSQQPYFSANTDWYAYFVLLLKSVLHIHPYGGVHKQYKSTAARAQAGITILDSAITYPPNARRPETLSDDLLHHLHRTFAQGQRGPFPLHLLTDYAAGVITCPHCGQPYPGARTHCPTCRVLTPARQPLPAQKMRELLRVDGLIVYARSLPNGRILAIAYNHNSYILHRLEPGSAPEAMPLFDGSPGCRFAAFQPQPGAPILAVNPPGGDQLLLLDVGGTAPRKVTMLATGMFRDTAVFATTPRHLIRIAGSWLMRGSLRDGLYVEDAIATAHHRQTQFWASPYTDVIVGCHRVFAELRYWLWRDGRSDDLAIPPLPAKASLQETAVAFAPDSIAIMRTIRQRGEVYSDTHIINQQGEIIVRGGETAVQQYPFTRNPDDPTPPYRPLPAAAIPANSILHLLPQGILVHRPHQIDILAVD